MSDTTIDATSRRRFLGGAAALGLAAAVLPGRAGAAGTGPAGGAAARQDAGSRFQLELAGVPSGFVTGVEGGSAYGEVVTETSGAKHLGGVAYEDIGFRLGLSMGRRMYAWIEQTLRTMHPRLDGTLVEASPDLTAVERRDFYQALISEIGFPALDAASKDPAALTVKIAPERVRFAPAGGKVQASLAKEKAWLASNFRFELGGIDTSRVTRIEAFSITQGPGDTIGSDRELTPGGLVLPNLTVTFAATNAGDLLKWHEDFVIKGLNGQDAERNGAIVFLAPNLAQELGRLELSNVGIFKLARTTDASGIRRFTVSLYVERMKLLLNDVDA